MNDQIATANSGDPSEETPLGIIEEGSVDFDDIPMAFSNIRSAYVDKVQQAHETSTPYRIVVTPDDWEALRSRIRRAVSALELDNDIDVISRKNRDGNIAVFITPKNPRNTPRKASK